MQLGHLYLIAQAATRGPRFFGFTRNRLNARETTTYAPSQRYVDGTLACGCDDPLAQFVGAGVGDTLIVQKPGQSAGCAQRRLVVTGHAER